jgi:hypothetical protein
MGADGVWIAFVRDGIASLDSRPQVNVLGVRNEVQDDEVMLNVGDDMQTFVVPKKRLAGGWVCNFRLGDPR